jgi:hypothetical protein
LSSFSGSVISSFLEVSFRAKSAAVAALSPFTAFTGGGADGSAAADTDAAEAAIRTLGRSGVDMKKLSLVGKGYHSEEQPMGFYTAGDRITAGEVIALSGNTGHSTGPHLHYQLEKAGEILDPVKVHGTFRREMPETDRTRFQAEVGRMTATLAAK